jgi:hypothetical protein
MTPIPGAAFPIPTLRFQYHRTHANTNQLDPGVILQRVHVAIGAQLRDVDSEPSGGLASMLHAPLLLVLLIAIAIFVAQ